MDNFVKARSDTSTSWRGDLQSVARQTVDGCQEKSKRPSVRDCAQANESFIEVSKATGHVAGKQMNANVKTAGKTLDLLQPLPFLPLVELARRWPVKSYVDAQRAVDGRDRKPSNGHQAREQARAAHAKRSSVGPPERRMPVAVTALTRVR